MRREQSCAAGMEGLKAHSMYEFEMRISISDEGQRILVLVSEDTDSGDSLAHAYIAYELVKRKLHEHEIQIVSVTPVGAFSIVVGYRIDTDASVAGLFEPYLVETK